jgi:hypothetical protein
MGVRRDSLLMNGSRLYMVFRTQLIVLTVILFAGCGVKGTSSTCGTNVAQISVFDNLVRRDCGCVEASSQTFTGQTLVCTVPIGTRLYIYYVNIQNAHQLTFSSSSIGTLTQHDPNTDGNHNPIDAITLSTTSAGISFVDSANGNGGNIIVQ